MKLQLDEPMIVAEIGINHNGDFNLARDMIRAVKYAGGKYVKFQCHIPDEEMSYHARSVIPPNAKEDIYSMMARCSFSEEQDIALKSYAEQLGLIYIATPFSLAAVERLRRMDVQIIKVGSGECNNIPLLEAVRSLNKPVILSTGMNDLVSIQRGVSILQGVPLAVLHCRSEYPTPYSHVDLGSLDHIRRNFPDVTVGLSDHSQGIYIALGAVALGAEIIEKHFTTSDCPPGPDIPLSITPDQLHDLIVGSTAIRLALGGSKDVLPDEMKTANFAFASIVSSRVIAKGTILTPDDITVKRPSGGIPAVYYRAVLGMEIKGTLNAGEQITWDMVRR